MSLTLALANQLLAKAAEAAATHGAGFVFVVTDSGGHPVALARMDGVSFINTEVAQRKAVLAAAFSTPTHQIHTMIGKDPVVAPTIHADPRIAMVPGGVPVMVDGACVGGLGVAGGHYMQDQAIAEYAVSQ